MNTISRIAALLLVIAPPTSAQAQQEPAPAADAASTFSPEQLEQIVAPIALHPDSLLSQIIMASTYPLEIVEAHRWVAKNASLKGDALEAALKEHDWDPSVKSMCGFPTVLKEMNDNLDWTQDLGDAYLGQKKELFDTVQKMRRKALDSGNLKSTEQQKVTQEGQIIIIQSASPEVVYVPTYSPVVVYGSSWHYPYYYYPPMYAPPPPGYGFVAFSAGVVWGAAIWGGCNWNNSDIDIDIEHHNHFNRNTSIDHRKNDIDGAGNNKGQFKHSPEHRKGVNYKSPKTAQQFGGAPGASRVTRDQARGFDRAGSGAGTPGGGATARPGSLQQPGGAQPTARDAANRAPGAAANRGAQAPARTAPAANVGGDRGTALSGSRSPAMDRSASSRGAASRGGGARGGRGGGGRR